jgi:hypothetical protein
MIMIITTPTKIQKNLSILSDTKNVYTIVKNWEPKTFLVPYFEWIEDYIEDLEMYANREKLVKQFKESSESWLSDLTI